MSRCDVGLPPGIRSNYGSDHLLVRRAERTILFLAARSQLHLIGSPNGTTGQLSPSMMKGQDHSLANVLTGGESGTADFHPPTLGRNQEEKKRLSEEINSLYFKKRPHWLSPVREFLQNGTQGSSFGERTTGLKERP